MSDRTITLDQVLRMTTQLPPGDKLRLISLLSEHVRDEWIKRASRSTCSH